MTRRAALAALVALPLMATGLHAQTIPARIRGTVQSLDGAILTVTTRTGENATVTLSPNYTISAIFPTTLAAIQPGSMIGIVGFGPPKQQRAAVVSIFPPGVAVNEAQFAWDSEPDSVMTNAPVTSQVASTDGRVLTVTIKGEPIQVTVSPNTIIQTSETGSPAMLVKGAQVLVNGQKMADGSVVASRVNVGKDGFTPAN